MIDPRNVLRTVWTGLGHDPTALDRVDLTGAEPVLPSSFAVGTAMQASVAASALAAAEVWKARMGKAQRVGVDMRAAAIAARSERYLQIEGQPAPELWDKIAGAYQCSDGRYVRLHTNFPHHRDGVLKLLGCAYEKAAVTEALKGWKAFDFEQAAADANLVVAAMRSFDEWDAHPQGQAIARLPLMSVERIGEAAPRGWPEGARPLAGIKVLDLTRIIAGPVGTLTLAAHGANVMLVTSPNLPSVAPLVIDTGRGKLSTHIDLHDAQGRDAFAALLREADIVVQGYRPGGLAALGFAPDAAARVNPGIVYVSLCAYSHEGPWAGRRGFDSLVQTASGFNDAEAKAAGIEGPKPLPAQILDHASGYLLAFAAMTALRRQRAEGGSWHVRLSLAQTGRWLRSLGRVDGVNAHDPARGDVLDCLEESDSGFGRLSAVRHPALMSETPPYWSRPSVPLGTHPPAWP
ncbi:CoA transferase [Undibacter mobilis]|uniref:CoA transferase n=1 Tax=Undibacter mobilis TaxID=2292256 RepID=A0A371B9K1_9BRAD|nr:CoA transferase [Undibacter mobilis]RDV04103.1 CoA transferase [Undibacter mobilis]